MSTDLAQLAPLAVLIPFVGAALNFVIVHRNKLQRTVTVGTMALTLVLNCLMLADVWNQGPQAVHLGGWAAPYGIVMVVDQLSALMLVVSVVVSLAVLVYAVSEGVASGDDEGPISIFYPTFLLLVAGVSNAFLAGDLFNLYVGFEILLTASYVLLTMGGTAQRIRAGVTYVVVSVISSILFLISLGMIYGATGTVNMADLSLKLADLPQGTQMQLHLMLLIAFGVKAAIFPLSFWLPDSYPTASAPVTAVFAGLLTKVGVYSIIRTETLLFPGRQINDLLMWVALLTMLVGILGALAQIDIKRMLSFTLISHIGYMIFGIAVGTPQALAAVVYYIAHHIVIQTSLFLVAGLIERRGGSTNVDRLAGLLRISPMLGVLYLVPALNLGGIPPFSGFLGKVGLIEAGVQSGTWLDYLLVGVSVFVSLLTLMALVRVWNRVFLRRVDDAEYPDPVLRATTAQGHRPRTSRVVAGNPASRFSDSAPVVLLPKTMVGATTALVAVGVALTVFAGPLFDLAGSAADNLVSPQRYTNAVLAPMGDGGVSEEGQ
ncbi:multicomponent Na+:H+ antiporter subunit D [Kocuria rhizophila]|uniref:Na(+)/H(+) antiporter subunit D n=1 Tax=Kocuria rhizophila (strain ATCC 9341 / DSM 348 / NBRC 103217 / DC2201) TaxID=378753 RepID=B2GGA7_KOCRD|nr:MULTISPECIES: Na+/H+ antiporter subunit D [Kocuria]HAG62820.1 Na+/H+ antiporter subunit D [Kocuria sp.]ASE11274.1 Na+/H+ antiporter subunit D [Kocuria rhizophila]MDV5998340.1 Na+/H+ antiporter subunit D [Kocuria rhizophila]WTI31442.1 Na+/H+ antiporter subunit D [Kocuria rhizophila]VEH75975.1 Multiple resistance and pH homeostasis protein D [Kocuria rhizophila]